MADLTLGIAKDIVKTGMAIKEALDTVRQNEEECEELQVLVATVIAILSRLEEVELTIHPAMCGALGSLNRSLGRALKLVTELQKRNGLHRFFTSRDMAKQLRRVYDDIQQKMQVGNFAITASMMEVTINLTKTTIFQYDGAHPLPTTRPQEAVKLEMFSSQSNAAGLMKFSLSETVTTHQVSEENINGGSSYTIVSKQKIVIKAAMPSDGSRAKVLMLAARASGVESVSIGGDGMDQCIVVGEGVDSVKLTAALRRKVGHAEVVQVCMADEAKKPPTLDRSRAVAVVRDEEEEEQQEPVANRHPRARSSGVRAITAKLLSRFIWRRPRKTSIASRPAPPLPPLSTSEHTDATARAFPMIASLPQASCIHLQNQQESRSRPVLCHAGQSSWLKTSATPDDPLLLRHQPATAAAAPARRRRRRTFNMSRVHRISVRLIPAPRRHGP